MERTTDWMARIILDAIWRSIVENKPVQVSREFAARVAPSELAEDPLIEEVADVCSKAADTFCRGHSAHIVSDLGSEVSQMRQAIDELNDMLNPLVLRPIILRTRCKLCPA